MTGQVPAARASTSTWQLGYRRAIALVASLLAMTAALLTVPSTAGAADIESSQLRASVSADLLPTVQIDGVAWSQITVGNTVYVTGDFGYSRPAGASAGSQETAANNILAYDIETGERITQFKADLNAQGLGLAASPDGSTIYVVGDFTRVNGSPRGRLAALDASSGSLVKNFAPDLSSRARTITVTDQAIYVGGNFHSAENRSRQRLAAYSATGDLLDWQPSADDNEVMALAASPDGASITVGGKFSSLNGVTAHGLGAVDAVTGETLSFPANAEIVLSGTHAGVTSLKSDGSQIFGTAYVYYGGGGDGNFEGSFSINPTSGELNWMDGCHGDTYDTQVLGGSVYVAGHAHDCANIDSYPEGFKGRTSWQRLTSFSYDATQLTNKEDGNRYDWEGAPSPSIQDFWPKVSAGSFTGQYQGTWSLSGNDQYLAAGGEFPKINSVKQQGLARFALRESAPRQVGPEYDAELRPSLAATGDDAIRIQWPTTIDRDNGSLTYRVIRDDKYSTPIHSQSTWSAEWDHPSLGYTDSGLTPGKSYKYRIVVLDEDGNSTQGPSASIKAGQALATPGDYGDLVREHGAVHYWPMGEDNATNDFAGGSQLALGGGVAAADEGAVDGEERLAAQLDGTSSATALSSNQQAAPNSFSVEAWVKTTSRDGGRIMGFGSAQSGTSSSTRNDRLLYLGSDGLARFGTNAPHGRTVVTSPERVNDGEWHHIVGTMDPESGLALYIDGARVAENTAARHHRYYAGYWRIGADNLSPWPGTGRDPAIDGLIDDLAVYEGALSAQQVNEHHALATSALPNQAPTASFDWQTNDLTVEFTSTASDPDGTINNHTWDFGDGTTSTATNPNHTYNQAGDYTVTLTVTDNDGSDNTTTNTITVTQAPPGPPRLASDMFERDLVGELGIADLGGLWSVSANGDGFAVANGVASVTAQPGRGRRAFLDDTPIRTSDSTITVALDRERTSGSTYFSFIGRRVSAANDYRTKVRFRADGSLQVILVARVEGQTRNLAWTDLPQFNYQAGEQVNIRLRLTGEQTTQLQTNVWRSSDSEPTDWLLSSDDNGSQLQQAGSVGFEFYNSGSANTAVAALLDDLLVVEP
jgi:PKD repeat protein